MWGSLFFYLFLTAFSMFCILGIRFNLTWMSYFKKNGINHLRVLPFFGNMLLVFFSREHYVAYSDDLRKKFPRDRFVGYYNFHQPIVVLQDLALIRRLTVRNFDSFHDRQTVSDPRVEPFFTHNLYTLRGSDWRDMRSTMSPAFTTTRIKEMIPLIEEVGERTINTLISMIQSTQTGSMEVDVTDFTMRLANDVIASCGFGLNVNSLRDRNNKFYEMGQGVSSSKFYDVIINLCIAWCPSITNIFNTQSYSEESRKYFCDIVFDEIRKRERERYTRPDMIQFLIENSRGRVSNNERSDRKDFGFACVPESAEGKRIVSRVWSHLELAAQIVMFFITGFETIYTTLSFALHELALNPKIQARLLKEILLHNARNNGRVTFKAIQSMTYMDMVVSETLRMWPPDMNLERQCNRDTNIGKPNFRAKDYTIRQGQVLLIPVWSTHRDPKLFPNPEVFDPERFSEQNKGNIEQTSYIPFGIGPRNCIGSKFALCEIKVLLYQILLHMEVYPSKNTCIPSSLSNISMSPMLKDGHWLMFKPRT